MGDEAVAAHLAVGTSSGLVRGLHCSKEVTSFLGIPYAAAPVGQFRWTPPRRHAGWLGIRDAFGFGPDCVQRPHPHLDDASHLRGSGLSEDCLYLNVWTPAFGSDERWPVMVWIHGDGWTRGAGSLALYDGHGLASQGVVVVTLNYRVGLAGFLAHPALSRESPNGSSGNYGLLDQIEALRWVQDNIDAFGGDPKRVTVFGQSAGASSISLLMASPLAKGLFSQAVLQSPGTGRPMATLSEAERAGEVVGSDLGELRKLSIETLLDLAGLLVPRMRKLASPRGLGPIVDGWVVQGDDVANYRDGRTRPIPLMIGSVSNEGRRSTVHWGMASVAELDKHLETSFGGIEHLPRSYRAHDDTEVEAALHRVVGDTQHNYGTWKVAREMRGLGAPVYHYLFARPTDGDGSEAAPTHDDELPYVFGTLALGGLRWRRTAATPICQAATTLSWAMMGAWVRFATTGDPNGGGLREWPLADGRTDILVFDDQMGLTSMPREADLEFLHSYFHPASNHT